MQALFYGWAQMPGQITPLSQNGQSHRNQRSGPKPINDSTA